MMQTSVGAVEAEQQRTDLPGPLGIAEAAHYAVGGTDGLDLQHRALSGGVGGVQPLGDYPIQGAAQIL